MIVHENPRPNTKRIYITDLVLLSRYFEHNKQWREFTRDDVMMFLQSYRKTPAADPKERWVNTVNRKTITCLKFFKWLYYPKLDREQRKKKKKPDVVKDLPLYRKKEKTSIEATDLWLPVEDKMFLKYCPDVRLQLYHTMADDTSGRPHELLAKRFSDVKIKQHNGRIFGEIEIGRGGKTKGRIVPLIMSIPYFKQWQSQNNDPNAFLFRAFSPQAKYKNRPLTVSALDHMYARTKEYFKTLLDRPDVPPEDKAIIKGMLEKPWNPYIRRHGSLTEKARLLKNDYSLRLHAGWTKNSKMVEIYTHELGGESSSDLLAAYGIIPKSIDGKVEMLQPKICPMCSEPNKLDARFCANSKCGMPLSFDAFEELKQKDEKQEHTLESVQEQMKRIEEENNARWELILRGMHEHPEQFRHIKPEEFKNIQIKHKSDTGQAPAA